MKKIFLSTLIMASTVIFNTFPSFAENTSITVATASNVQFAMKELKEAFKKETNIEVKPIISSSGKLTAQIINGAPFDVFMSADMEFPEKLYKEGSAIAKPEIYSYGTLVLWTMDNFDLSKPVELFQSEKISKIAIANPKVAPYGEEAINVLNYYKVFDKVKDKLVYGESVSQVNNYVTLKTVELGFTSKSIVVSPEMKGKGKWKEVDNKAYKPIAQGVVILKYGKENNFENSKKFYAFLFSKKAKAIFQKYGYSIKK